MLPAAAAGGASKMSKFERWINRSNLIVHLLITGKGLNLFVFTHIIPTKKMMKKMMMMMKPMVRYNCCGRTEKH